MGPKDLTNLGACGGKGQGEVGLTHTHPQPWQEGTSKFATLEMNPKRAQKRPKETVSVPEVTEKQGGCLPESSLLLP